MISYQEPRVLELTSAQRVDDLRRFALVLQSFLLIYLCLHNVAIPILLNLYRGHPVLSDLHFWFLSQVLLYFAMRKHPQFAANMVLPITVGSLLRLSIETSRMSLAEGMSWEMLSIWISELSSLIMCAFYLSQFKIERKHSWWWLLPLAVPALVQLEVHRESFSHPRDYVRKKSYDASWHLKGCQGSLIDWTQAQVVSNEGGIADCGFRSRISSLDIPVSNHSTQLVQFRVARLELNGNRLQARFLRLIILKPGTSVTLDYPADSLLLLSSIQQKWLGLQLKVGSLAAKNLPDGHYHISPYAMEFQDESHVQ